MPPRSPPLTNSPTRRFAWWGWRASLTMIQNCVTAVATKTSAQNQKARDDDPLEPD